MTGGMGHWNKVEVQRAAWGKLIMDPKREYEAPLEIASTVAETPNQEDETHVE